MRPAFADLWNIGACLRALAGRRALLAAILLASCGKPAPAVKPKGWPPVVGEPYPDLTLTDATGKRVSISSFRGRVVLVEPVGVP